MENKTSLLRIPDFKETLFKISKGVAIKEHHYFQIDSHIHDECEIYINLSGDISFFCNDRIYPMTRGDVLIAKPGDYHHCMYRSNAKHEHFWILFEYEQNRELWETFFKTPFKNVYRPTPEKKEKLITICDLLNNDNNSPGERLGLFFDILSIIRNSDSLESGDIIVPADKNFIEILDYINNHLYEKITVESISEAFFVSISTLERYFTKYTDCLPAEYIRRKKLIEASRLLKEGYSVSDTVSNLGYSDDSYFIEIFKKHFGMTPHKFKKKYHSKLQ